jgi:type VI secretion system protein ImpA
MVPISTLLYPLADDSLCGLDMIFSREFDTLRELRREDDPTLDQGAWTTSLKRADWAGVEDLCEQLLAHRTKDLRVAGWYAEAAARTRGYAGLADGLAVYAGLVREFWQGVHPRAEGGDQELRIGSITWLLSQLILWCRRVALLRHEGHSYTLVELDLARQRAQSSPEGLANDGHPNMEDILRAQGSTPLQSLQAALEEVRRLPALVVDLQTAVDERLGADGPGFVAAREAVAGAVESVERLVRERGGGQPQRAELAGQGVGDGPTALGLGPGMDVEGPPASRAQALLQLRQVAEFFRRTEPHSPVAYLAERAASWGEMPLHAWLRHVMKDGATLAQLEELLGVPPQSGP